MRIGKGRTVGTKGTATQAITNAVVVSLGVKREWVKILFDECDRENWATGGELRPAAMGRGR